MSNIHPKIEQRCDEVLIERTDELAEIYLDLVLQKAKVDLQMDKMGHGMRWLVESMIKRLILEKARLDDKEGLKIPIDDLLHLLAQNYAAVRSDLEKK